MQRAQRCAALLGMVMALGVPAAAENPCGIMFPTEDEAWGVGACWLPADVEVALLGQPGGAATGVVRRAVEPGSHRYSPGEVRIVKGAKEHQADTADLVKVGQPWLRFLKVYSGLDGTHIEVLKATAEGQPGMWIDLAEAKKAGVWCSSYRMLLAGVLDGLPAEVATQVTRSECGVNLPGSCLNLRDEPSLEGTPSTCVPSNKRGIHSDHTHLRISAIRGDWAFVSAIRSVYDPSPDDFGEGCSFRQAGSETGWVKVVDDTGAPHVWYAMSAY